MVSLTASVSEAPAASATALRLAEHLARLRLDNTTDHLHGDVGSIWPDMKPVAGLDRLRVRPIAKWGALGVETSDAPWDKPACGKQTPVHPASHPPRAAADRLVGMWNGVISPARKVRSRSPGG